MAAVVEPSSKTVTQLQRCLKYLEKLQNKSDDHSQFAINFRNFLKSLSTCLMKIKENKMVVKHFQDKFHLCLSQIFKTLKLFSTTFEQPLNLQALWYLCDRLIWCLSELCCLLTSPETAENMNFDNSNNFSHLIDLALQLVHNCDMARWNQLISDIVCQAVTIAKIACLEDYKEITSSCHKLLKESSQYMNNMETGSSELFLLVESLAATLVTLEQRINCTVLRMYLQVFAEPNKPIKQLVRQCGSTNQPHSVTDFENLVLDLDAHVERILLIGQFATFSCENRRRIAEIRCCLASIESLDNYIVPALKTFCVPPKSQDKKCFAEFLCLHWQDELSKLHYHLDDVIESRALLQIAQESLNDLHKQLCDGVSAKDIGNTIVKQAWLLYRHLTRTKYSCYEGYHLSKFKQAIHDLEIAVLKKLPQRSIVKRARCINMILDSIYTELNESSSYEILTPLPALTFIDKKSGPKKNISETRIKVSPRHVKNRSVKKNWVIEEDHRISKSKENIYFMDKIPVSNISVTTDIRNEKNVNLLTPYLSRTTERSTTLYHKTPCKLANSTVMDKSVIASTTKTTSTLSDDSYWENFVLDITNILDNLSDLADTFSSKNHSDCDNWTQPQPIPIPNDSEIYCSGNSFNSRWFSKISEKSNEMSYNNTCERLEDLKVLE